MKMKMKIVDKLQAAALALVVLTTIASAQMTPSTQNTPGTQPTRNPLGIRNDNEANPIDPAVQEHIEKGRQNERQKKLIADTDRLLVLANELKADMDKTTKDQLSIQVIRKAEEIEKLAHSVKERMKG